MKLWLKALAISLLAHSAVTGGVLLAARHGSLSTQPVMINFTLENPGLSSGGIPEPDEKRPASGQHNVAVYKTGNKTVQTVLKPGQIKRKTVSGKKCRVPENPHPESESGVSANGTSRGASEAGKGGAGKSSRGMDRPESGVTGLPPDSGERYMREQFSYIRELIRKNLRYPRAASSMGLEGKALISFMILENGSLTDIEVSKSSGSRLLDLDAVDTVARAAPFPPPPVAAKIIIPVEYILE